ncbi:O-antigen polymerase [Algoriphagus sp.]|uniref:O-antigen polymerase n=1 Tax=Algoriphagus sp. TaxID=1872435 RepID=UPI00261BC87D|nr:O-antigen polymerase [Algoriphagus sp.]
MKHSYYKLIILLVSFIVFVISYEFNFSNPKTWVCLIPITFGLLFYLIVPNPKNVGVGYIMLNIVFIAKYFMFPFFYVYSNYYSPYNSLIRNESLIFSYFYILLEMLLVLTSLRFFYNRHLVKINNFIVSSYSYKLPIAFVFLLTFIYIFSPVSFSNFSFILSPNEFVFEKEFQGSTAFIFFIKWGLYIIPLFGFIFFYKKYVNNPKFYYFVLSVLPLLFSTLFYFSNSRLSILIPLFSFWFVLTKFYSKFSKLISLYFLAYGLFSMLLLTLIKFFSVSNINSVSFNYEIGSYFLNSYFHGIPNISLGIQAADQYYNNIQFSNILDELFAQVMFLNDFFNIDDRSNFYFNSYLGTRSNIVPTLTEASMLFGRYFFWILTPILTYFICFFDKLSFQTSRIDNTFVYSFFSVSIGFFIFGNLNLISDSFFTYFIPIFILSYLNRVYIFPSRVIFK